MHMKKISMAVLMAVVTMGGAFAEFDGAAVQPAAVPEVANGKGGFVGGAETIVTIEQVEEMRPAFDVCYRD